MVSQCNLRLSLSLSYLLQCRFFLIWPMCGRLLASWGFLGGGEVLLEEIVLCVAVDSVCPWEKVNLGSLYIAIFNCNLFNFKIVEEYSLNMIV